MILATIIEFYLALRKCIEGRKFYGRIVELPFGLVLKISSLEGASEGDIIRFVQRHTTIPTPQVVASVEGHERRFLVMKKVQCLERVWGQLDDTQRRSIVKQLHSFLALLRALPPPHGRAVCALNAARLTDSRITSGGAVGPFLDEHDFNDRVVQTSRLFLPAPDIVQHRARMRGDHAIVFTHGDVAPRNVVVDGGSDRVMALLDWQQAGWYPEHWEWVKAIWCPPSPKAAGDLWVEAVPDMFAEDYADEWEVERGLSDNIVGGF
ncbi:kinase-like protein [Trametes maxima]|nr:kinase-like protein [Trametes maxima]